MDTFVYALGGLLLGGAAGGAMVFLIEQIRRRIARLWSSPPPEAESRPVPPPPAAPATAEPRPIGGAGMRPVGAEGQPVPPGSRASTPPVRRPIDRAELIRLIEAALDVQRKDRDMRLAEAWQWGDTGYWVGRAVRQAEAVLCDVPETGDLNSWLQSRREVLADVHERYRQEADDPDGYGSGTFHELRRALDEIDAMPAEDA